MHILVFFYAEPEFIKLLNQSTFMDPLMSTRLKDKPNMSPTLKDSHFPWEIESMYCVYIVIRIIANIYRLWAMW